MISGFYFTSLSTQAWSIKTPKSVQTQQLFGDQVGGNDKNRTAAELPLVHTIASMTAQLSSAR